MKNQYKKHYLGTRKSDGAKIYLDAPKFACGWYWSFGYLGNESEHYHLSNYNIKNHVLKLEDGTLKIITEARNICMRDALLNDYNLSEELEKNLWTFCELAMTAYTLKAAAETLGRGGSHMTDNPCKEEIKNADEVKRINEIVLPSVFKAIDDLLEKK